ncbi:MAG: glycine zipper 2TM domain-containing protein [Betaproteobacteria bacterium]|nr:glycine zipper 2TM domain-containing protein [Betaproteobacteria bacterium]
MFQTASSRIVAVVLAFFLAACASSGGPYGEREVRSGVIEQITPVQITSSQGVGVGAVVGGVVGFGVGSLIGKGSGRDVARVLGTVGGAFAGHKVQQHYAQPVQGQQIVVRTDNGVLVTITQPANPTLAVGQNVTITGSGEDARVVPR